MGEDDVRAVLARRNQSEDDLMLKKIKIVRQMEVEFEVLKTKMMVFGQYNDKEETIINLITKRPQKSALAKPRSKQKTMKHVHFSSDEPKVYFIHEIEN